MGGALRLYCISTLGKFWSFKDLSVRTVHRLVTRGPYSVVLHRSYTGLDSPSPNFRSAAWDRRLGWCFSSSPIICLNYRLIIR
ncbi:hypothetical protein F4604DRAFT_574321 [Suillus subluteus]|nr:hypothetical protein F4604DRAFT_574321 [Suillus subluteus]